MNMNDPYGKQNQGAVLPSLHPNSQMKG